MLYETLDISRISKFQFYCPKNKIMPKFKRKFLI